jgi:hypothetical protein
MFPGVDTSGGETDGNTEHGDEDEVTASASEISQNHQPGVISYYVPRKKSS